MNVAAKIDAYIDRHPDWTDELNRLRGVLLASTLTEDVKWGGPCYTMKGSNVVGIGAFKQHIALWFHQGALLKDPDGVLINAQAGKTKAMRQWRFEKGDKIPITRIKAYVREAAKIAEEGKSIKPEKRKLVVPPLLATSLSKDKKLKTSFENLKPGLQREYADFISDAKREETQRKRMEKIRPMILEGIGLNDKYRQ